MDEKYLEYDVYLNINIYINCQPFKIPKIGNYTNSRLSFCVFFSIKGNRVCVSPFKSSQTYFGSSHCCPNQFYTCFDQLCTGVTWQNLSWTYIMYWHNTCPRPSATQQYGMHVGIHLAFRHIQQDVNAEQSPLIRGKIESKW